MNLIPPNEIQFENIKKQEYYQSADHLNQDVTQLIQWMAKQPHLPKIKGELLLYNNISKTLKCLRVNKILKNVRHLE